MLLAAVADKTMTLIEPSAFKSKADQRNLSCFGGKVRCGLSVWDENTYKEVNS
jgi:hypothetical protein